MTALRRLALIGTIVTVVDVAGLIGLVLVAGWPAWLADTAAVSLATVLSWLLHSLLTPSEEPALEWFRRARAYWTTALAALVVDVAVLSVLVAAFDPGWWLPLLATKAVALAAAFGVRAIAYRSTMFDEVRSVQSEPARRPPAPGRVRLSVVVPAYREADRIGDTVVAIRAALADVAANGGLEVVVVDDGSDDATADAAERAGADLVLRRSPNRGKGAAVRAGVLAAGGRTVAFTDADLSYAPEQLLSLLDGVEAGWDVVVGSRRHVDTRTVVRAGRMRELGGRVINLFTALVLLGRYRDTQCGLKAMRSDVGRAVFSHSGIDGFAFDVEVFHLVERYRLSLLEAPVEVVNTERSTVNVGRDAARLVRDLFRIRRRARIGGYEADLAELPPRSDGAEPAG